MPYPQKKHLRTLGSFLIEIVRDKPVFPNLFRFAAPLLNIEDIWRHPYSWLNRYKDQGIVTIGGIPDNSSRHPGWESLG